MPSKKYPLKPPLFPSPKNTPRKSRPTAKKSPSRNPPSKKPFTQKSPGTCLLFPPRQILHGDSGLQKFNSLKYDVNSGAGHLIYINSDGAGFKSSIGLNPMQEISVWTFEVQNHHVKFDLGGGDNRKVPSPSPSKSSLPLPIKKAPTHPLKKPPLEKAILGHPFLLSNESPLLSPSFQKVPPLPNPPKDPLFLFKALVLSFF